MEKTKKESKEFLMIYQREAEKYGFETAVEIAIYARKLFGYNIDKIFSKRKQANLKRIYDEALNLSSDNKFFIKVPLSFLKVFQGSGDMSFLYNQKNPEQPGTKKKFGIFTLLKYISFYKLFETILGLNKPATINYDYFIKSWGFSKRTFDRYKNQLIQSGIFSSKVSRFVENNSVKTKSWIQVNRLDYYSTNREMNFREQTKKVFEVDLFQAKKKEPKTSEIKKPELKILKEEILKDEPKKGLTGYNSIEKFKKAYEENKNLASFYDEICERVEEHQTDTSEELSKKTLNKFLNGSPLSKKEEEYLDGWDLEIYCLKKII